MSVLFGGIYDKVQEHLWCNAVVSDLQSDTLYYKDLQSASIIQNLTILLQRLLTISKKVSIISKNCLKLLRNKERCPTLMTGFRW